MCKAPNTMSSPEITHIPSLMAFTVSLDSMVFFSLFATGSFFLAFLCFFLYTILAPANRFHLIPGCPQQILFNQIRKPSAGTEGSLWKKTQSVHAGEGIT